MNASCRRALRSGSPLYLVGFSLAESDEISEGPHTSNAFFRSITDCFKFFDRALRTAPRCHPTGADLLMTDLCRVQLEVHGAAKGRGNVHQRIDGEARDPPA
jgi:hypothetical protein